jgi:3'-phosphoadenosine 5'-phosphosulfate (PAPS) 3'-phosphatase
MCPRLSPSRRHAAALQVADLIDSGGAEGGKRGTHWVLDPIDGTRGFVAMRQYAVCLGMLVEGEVVLGVLGTPNLPQVGLKGGGVGGGVIIRGVPCTA